MPGVTILAISKIRQAKGGHVSQSGAGQSEGGHVSQARVRQAIGGYVI